MHGCMHAQIQMNIAACVYCQIGLLVHNQRSRAVSAEKSERFRKKVNVGRQRRERRECRFGVSEGQ